MRKIKARHIAATLLLVVTLLPACATLAQIGNWSAWLDFALRAAGVVATAAGV